MAVAFRDEPRLRRTPLACNETGPKSGFSLQSPRNRVRSGNERGELREDRPMKATSLRPTYLPYLVLLARSPSGRLVLMTICLAVFPEAACSGERPKEQRLKIDRPP